jgi:hypothetical protein
MDNNLAHRRAIAEAIITHMSNDPDALSEFIHAITEGQKQSYRTYPRDGEPKRSRFDVGSELARCQAHRS